MELLSVPFAMKDLQEVDGSPREKFRSALACHSTRGYHARGGRGRRPLRSSRLVAANVFIAAGRRPALPSAACVPSLEPPAREFLGVPRIPETRSSARDGPGRAVRIPTPKSARQGIPLFQPARRCTTSVSGLQLAKAGSR